MNSSAIFATNTKIRSALRPDQFYQRLLKDIPPPTRHRLWHCQVWWWSQGVAYLLSSPWNLGCCYCSRLTRWVWNKGMRLMMPVPFQKFKCEIELLWCSNYGMDIEILLLIALSKWVWSLPIWQFFHQGKEDGAWSKHTHLPSSFEFWNALILSSMSIICFLGTEETTFFSQDIDNFHTLL
jgi:hypothetical protein